MQPQPPPPQQEQDEIEEVEEARPRPPPPQQVQRIGEPPKPKKELTVEVFTAACREGDAATVQSFLAANARTHRGLADCEEALFDAYGDSVLHHAVLGGSSKEVKLLLELGRIQVD